jgi:glucoamylase
MNKELKEKLLRKIYENSSFSKKKGMIIASPSSDPPYKYHWIRDSALVMRVIISEYKKNMEDKNLVHIINYIENEYHIQNMKTLTGLGEPKINIDGTPYNEQWGRPQNDGPALRCINLIEIYKILEKDYKYICQNILIEMIEKDIRYVIENKNEICFDLWEEIQGWHFYTRLVQLKCIKDYISISNNLEKYFKLNVNIKNIYNEYLENIKDHIEKGKGYISSFNIEGDIIRRNDASIILAFCHISFDENILKEIPLENVMFNIEELTNYFSEKYDKKINLIGRYKNDQYYNGHVWILCSFALGQLYNFLAKKKNYKGLLNKSSEIYNEIMSIDEELNLHEQFDIKNNKGLSAKKLTWNYSEMYFFTESF